MYSTHPPRKKTKTVEVRMIAVYGVNQKLDSEPRGWMPLVDASALVEDGFAQLVTMNFNGSRGKAIQLLERKPLKPRDASCQMGPRIIEANAFGEKFAEDITKLWNPALMRLDPDYQCLQTSTL